MHNRRRSLVEWVQEALVASEVAFLEQLCLALNLGV